VHRSMDIEDIFTYRSAVPSVRRIDRTTHGPCMHLVLTQATAHSPARKNASMYFLHEYYYGGKKTVCQQF
jgi:hypothetical protein